MSKAQRDIAHACVQGKTRAYLLGCHQVFNVEKKLDDFVVVSGHGEVQDRAALVVDMVEKIRVFHVRLGWGG